MAMLKKNRSALCCSFVAAVMVIMATTLLLSLCDAHKETIILHINDSAALFVPASCYSNYFPHCTYHLCKKFCGSVRAPPVPGAFCNDRSNCCCPVS
ncbi:uncharacterized protein LOC123407731 [Hordeum vulgare subsp. vulgare]|uniref:uncharacterized protein LOC123407731 n=1 Tax=Hordeum vulgare subsp. vulgare TaxID=112509 RepID=UPI001D1A4D80|nr:uncharacterized protein LOC123407731 [Hordeum vulgare subsp. vulgare]